MSIMADKSPAAVPTTQVPPPNWHAYNMNLYNMNMYQNPYMYNAAYGAHNYYQYYGQRMQQAANWNTAAYRGFTPGTPMQPWGTPAQQPIQQPVAIPEQQPQIQQQSEQTQQTNEKSPADINDEVPTELPPLPPGPPPPNPAPPGTQAPPPRPFLLPNPTTPIRFNMNTPRTRAPLAQNNPLGVRPQTKRNKKKKKKQQQQQQQQQMQQQQQSTVDDDDEEDEPADIPPLPASPPPPPPPPPPPVIAPPPPPTNQQLQATTVVPQTPPGIRSIEDWPLSLKDYVNRCYSKCVTPVDLDRVGVILKGKIMRATNDGILWTKNWTEEPLPLLDSDTKPAGGLNLGINLKDKLNKMSNRLGPPQKNQEHQRQSEQQPTHKRSYRPSFKRSYSSDSSSSSSSDSDSNSSNNKRRDTGKRSQSSWSSSKRHTSKKLSEKHLYKEYGTIGGNAVPVKKEVLDKRAARFSTDNNGRMKNGNHTTSSPSFVIDCRPNPAYVPKTVWSSINYDPPKMDMNSSSPPSGDWEEDLHIVGTSTDIEKQYLRLTSAPDASQVRPPNILAKSLSMVKEKWAKEADYHYTCEQLKSIRQDLTVQGVRDSFTVEVYETHARIALEKGDHAEFNQCQTQLSQLHTPESKNRGEFIAYRILYFIFTNEFLDMSTLVQSLSSDEKEEPCTNHALQMAKAWACGLYSRLFKLYLSAPRMSPYLIDWFLNRERLKALKVIIKAYRPAVPVDLVTKELAFSSIGDTFEFIDKYGLIFTDNSRTKIDCKSSTAVLASV